MVLLDQLLVWEKWAFLSGFLCGGTQSLKEAFFEKLYRLIGIELFIVGRGIIEVVESCAANCHFHPDECRT